MRPSGSLLVDHGDTLTLQPSVRMIRTELTRLILENEKIP